MNIEKITVTMLPDGRMDTRNAAQYLGLSEKTLAMMRCNGTGPAFVKCGRVFYYKADLDAWLASYDRVTSTVQCRPQKRGFGGFFE
jgi:predicted DNA-binding transcriptional regulator AlpA